ncbi:DUF6284 family protein [Dactylosporangium sp. NBC_01737]|uniref:DUF6284 family protein n=1 Tax=Dactylosporangium sp. NBC_01737 TaxID=2975959 RepID=UPI002E121B0C|nr:DUF6284 family protein [Dactylosporangium sp. NBC_01737]
MIYERDDPTPAELAAIEDEWPLIEAEMDLLDVQVSILAGHGRVDDLEAQRLRNARDMVVRESLAWYCRRFNAQRPAA